jgi:hypothetical protein
VLSIQSAAAAWVAQLTEGAASLGAASRSGAQVGALGGDALPALHPRVAALLQSYEASAAQLASIAAPSSAGLQSYGSFGLPVERVGSATGMAAAAAAAAASGVQPTAATAGVYGSAWAQPQVGAAVPAAAKGNRDVSAAWMKSAALTEWQRLRSLASAV